jgi:hypothetical protein
VNLQIHPVQSREKPVARSIRRTDEADVADVTNGWRQRSAA